jgi:hypothetical protein
MSAKKPSADRVHENPEQDAMSGYASADVLDETPDQVVGGEPGAADQARDPMSGYASGDEIEPESD